MIPLRAPLVAGVVVALLVAAAGALRFRESYAPLPLSQERLMYLRSGRVADRLFLTFDALAADVYWMRAIQHYGGDRRSPPAAGRFELLQPMLDLVTTLDPHFNVAFRFGAIFLSMDPPDGPARPDQAIALLEKGLAYNPDRWQYAHDIGFVHFWHTGNLEEAATWFDRASEMPGAPDWIRQVAAVTLVQGGDRSGARRILTELVGSGESYIRAAAERSLAQLDALDAIDRLDRVVEGYREATGMLPTGWPDLIRQRYLPGIPVDRTGTPFRYDPSTARITIGPGSSLLPLPLGLGRHG